MSCSGLTWHPHLGCNIVCTEDEDVWAKILPGRPDCAPFKNAGWEPYDDLARLHPAKPKGTNTFRPASGAHGLPDPSLRTEPHTPSSPRSRQPSPLSDLGNNHAADAHDDAPVPDDAAAPDRDVDTAADDENVPPPAPTTAAPATPSLDTRKRAASQSTAPPPSSKRARGAAAATEALQGIGKSLDRFGQIFADSTNKLVDVLRPPPNTDHERCARALEVMQEKDSFWLTLRQRVQLGNVLDAPGKAASYLKWDATGEAERMVWVADELGIPLPEHIV